MAMCIKPQIMPSAALDWLAVTLHGTSFVASDRPWEAFPIVDPAGWRESRPRLGYRRAYEHEPTGVVMLGDPPTEAMGEHIIWSGRAIDKHTAALAEATGRDDAMQTTVKFLFWNHDATASRVDVAYDTDAIDPASIAMGLRYKAVNGETEPGTECLVTRAINPVQCIHRVGTGRGTYTLGERGAMYYLRVYDKAHEQAEWPHEAPRGYDALHRWTRIEYELRQGAAQEVVVDWLAGNWQRIGARCASFASVRTATNDSNASRWPLAPAWAMALRSPHTGMRAVAEGPEGNRLAWFGSVAKRVMAQHVVGLGEYGAIAYWLALADAGKHLLSDDDVHDAEAWAASHVFGDPDGVAVLPQGGV